MIPFKLKYTLSLALGLSTFVASAQDIEKPHQTSKSSFAIVVDKATYENAKEEINAYKRVVENDGMGTYIVWDDWKSPDQIRSILHKLYKDKKSPLEGAVFIGNIPVPMLRDAQF